MGKNVEVSLEAFGNKRLTATFKPEELKGKNVGDIVSLMMSRDWNGEARQAHAIISREIQVIYCVSSCIFKTNNCKLY